MFKRIYPLIIFFNLITALAWAAPDGVKQNLSVNSTTELAELDTGGGTTWEELEDGDICWVISATGLSFRIYIYDSDSAQTEDGERYVTPDESSTGVAYSGDARWVCMSTAQAGSDGDYFLELGNNTAIDPDASKYQVYFDAGELKVNENGTEKYIANLTDAQTFAGAITLNAGGDFNDADITSIDRLEGIDATEYIDLGADGYVVVDAGTAINLDSSVQAGDGTYSWDHTPAFGIEGILEVDGAVYLDGAVTFGSTVSGSAADMTVVATGFDGNLATTDNTLQEIAQKLDDLTAGGSSDPDALDGDTTDDNLIDSAIIAAFAHQASPNWIFYDSDNAGADEECARIEANATTTTDGAEDADLIFSVMQGGTVTPVLTFDESDDQWETTKAMTFAGGAITGATTFSGAGEINLPSSDASPDVAGEIRHDSTVTGLTTGALAWYDGDEVRYIVDLDVLPSNDDYVVSYDADNDIFYMKEDATGAGGGDSISVDGSAVVDPNFDDGGDINFTDSSNTVTASLKADVVGTDEMADADHGMGSWTSGALTVEDFALNADADAGDYDIQSIDRLEGIDATEFIDMGADGYVVVDAGTAINLDSSVQCGDGTYSWGHTPAFGIEGILEVDGAAYLDGGLTSGGAVALGANNLTMTGSLAATGSRVTKGWFTDIESTNMPTVGGTALFSAIPATLANAAASTWTVVDNNASGLSIGSTGKADILKVVSTDAGEGVTMSGTLGVTGLVTASAGITVADSQVLTFDESAANPDDADIQLSATDGVFKIASVNGANNEDLTINLDDTANTATVSSSTGVTGIDLGDINLLAGYLQGLTRGVVLTHASGVHDGSNDQATLTDSGESFTTNSMVGMTIYNITDGSSGLVTANNGTTITATLSGGTGNDWDTNDVWQVGPGPDQSGSVFYVGAASTIRHPATVGYVAQYYATAAAAITVDVVSASMVITNATAAAVDAGDSIDSPATAGSFICLHNASATLAYSHGKNGTWTDGGAD